MQLTLGPVLYNWAPDQWRDFYFRVAEEAPVDVAVIGEIVCSKRSPFFAEHMPAVIERLAACGKQVVLGSLILVSLKRERQQMAELAENTDFMVEANDLTCLGSLADRPHAIGLDREILACAHLQVHHLMPISESKSVCATEITREHA